MTKVELQREWSVTLLCLLSGAAIFWTALHCEGWDWFISETHADVIYSGLRRFREYPFFSFAINGGTYFLQDPQSNLYSPAVPLIWLAGPSIGLRLAEGLVVAAGGYGFVVWMKTRVSTEAALVGAVASATSLGVLWKVAVGNDMFMWHLGLPGLLWCAQEVIKERTLRRALIMGLLLGVLLLGPTFHSFTYLFLPVVPIFVVFELVLERPTMKELAKVAALFLGACVIALLIASPKLVCWAKFPMARPIGDYGVIGWRTVLRSLFDYSWVQRDFVQTAYVNPQGAWITGSWWGTEECAVAMPPVGSLLALVGLGYAFRARGQRALASFALLLIACGVALSCFWPIWSGFRSLSGGNFRVAQRFLGLPAFGLIILATLGAEAIFARWRKVALPAALVTAGLMLGSTLWWTWAAGRATEALTDDPNIVQLQAMNPFKVAAQEREQTANLKGFSELVKFDSDERTILEGVGYKDGFLVVGNRHKKRLYKTRRRGRRRTEHAEQMVVEGIAASHVRVTHLGITVSDLPPHSRVRLRVMMPTFGLSTRTNPLDANVAVVDRGAYLRIENRGDQPVRRVRLRADLPMSRGWYILSFGVGLGVLVTLSVERLIRKRALLSVGVG